MIIRVRSRDGLERVTVPDGGAATVAALHSRIESQLGVPAAAQTLSLNPELLLSSPAPFLSDPSASLSSLGLSHGSVVYLSYAGFARSSAPPAPPLTPAGSFGRKMTVDDLIARQIRVSRQEAPHCTSASFDRDAAHAFQLYVAETLAFAVKRGGFLYGRVADGGAVAVDFIYEPPQQGTEETLALLRDPDEEVHVEAIAAGLGMRRVGFVFTQAVGRKRGTGEYTMSGREVLQAAEIQAEGAIPEWVTAVVKLEVAEDGAADVHFEAFQLSDTCVRLFKEGWFMTEFGEDDDPRLSRMKKDVVVGVKDVREVDNDFFLVPVKISDHQGLLSSSFPIQNRITTVALRSLKNHMDRTKHLPFVKRISDFHLLLLLSRFLDVNADVPALAECVQRQATVPEGYQLLIESLAAST
ncbi:NPL4-like protein [Phoenix dactylifera]|uniref:NPL4-like protein n=1 Tax=Phoenix dactylifera TaxID=42345 RepID=A0A8B9ABC9_PHODC|nr:NPL4-like protein [Phoenix dactylifera]XP_038981228.1 NPL4-like protein [Phoenix dactylifera]